MNQSLVARSARAVITVAVGLMLWVGPQSARAQCEFEWSEGFNVPGANGLVLATMVFDDGHGPALFVGGDFSSVGGIRANKIAKWDGQRWSALGDGVSSASFGSVTALAVFDDGGGPALYVAGSFENAGGVIANNIARWHGQTWSALGDGIARITSPVAALAVFDDGHGDALYAGGAFFAAGGVSVNHIARWNGAEWSALGSGLDGGTIRFPLVAALAVYDDGHGKRLYAAGQFDFAGGANAGAIARWDGQQWASLGTGVSGGIFGLTIGALSIFDDGNGRALFAAGRFDTAGGGAVSNIARWDGSNWSSLASGISGENVNTSVRALTVFDDGRGQALYAGGLFDTAGSADAHNVTRWDGSNWSPVALDDRSDPVLTLASFDEGHGTGPALFAGGRLLVNDFGRAASGIARWNGSNNWTSLGDGNGTDAWVAALEVFDNGFGPLLYAGGGFRSADHSAASRIARWTGRSWGPLAEGIGGDFPVVSALQAFDDGSGPALFVGGNFTSAGTINTNAIAKWNGSSWSDVGGGTEFRLSVHALAVFDDGNGEALYAGGSFGTAGGNSANAIAKWDGVSWSPLGLGILGEVHALTVYDDGTGPALYAAGRFSAAGGQSAHGIAKWNGRDWSTLGEGVGHWTILDLAVFDDGETEFLYAGGTFQTAGGVGASGIARWDGREWFGVDGGVSGLASIVEALTVFDDGSGSSLYVAGRFTAAGGVSAAGIARWDGRWSPLGDGLAGNTNASVGALAGFDDGRGAALYVGGQFGTAGQTTASNIARWGCSDGCDPCDMNCDGNINALDIEPFLDLLFGGSRPCAACTGDTNGDGTIDALDIEPFLNCLFP